MAEEGIATLAETRAATRPTSLVAYMKAIYENVPLVYASGGKSWKNNFWKYYQDEGGLADYTEVFSGAGWTKEYFEPAYDIHPTKAATNLFANSTLGIDLTSHLQTLGVELIMSHATDISGAFYNTDFTRLPDIKIGGLLDTTCWHLFSGSDSLATIDAIELSAAFENSEAVVLWSQCFENCSALRNITFTGNGTIRENIDLQWSPELTKSSINNIVKYLNSSTSSKICRLSLQAVNSAFETSDGLGDGVASEGWASLIESKPNWSFALV